MPRPAEPLTTHEAFLRAADADYRAQEVIVAVASRVLEETVRRNDARCTKQGAGTAPRLFESAAACPLAPTVYLQRILKYTACSWTTIPVGLIYLQRLREACKDSGAETMRLTSYNIQRLLLAAMMVASKFLDEPTASNKQWGLVGDLTVAEMNALELEMLWSLKFSLGVSVEEYDECWRALVAIDTVDQQHQTPSEDVVCSSHKTACRDSTGQPVAPSSLERGVRPLLTPRSSEELGLSYARRKGDNRQWPCRPALWTHQAEKEHGSSHSSPSSSSSASSRETLGSRLSSTATLSQNPLHIVSGLVAVDSTVWGTQKWCEV